MKRRRAATASDMADKFDVQAAGETTLGDPELPPQPAAGSAAKDEGAAGVDAHVPPPKLALRSVTLGHLEDTPRWAHLPHLVRGYRLNHGPVDALLSLFSLHIDTINVWTHLLGSLWFLSMLPHTWEVLGRNGAPWYDYGLFAIFHASAQFQMLASAAYHAFRCVDPVYDAFFLQLDIYGILCMVAGSFTVGMGQGFECAPGVFALYLGILLSMLCGSVYLSRKALKDASYFTPYYAVTAAAVGFGVLPCLHWYATCLGQHGAEACFAVMTRAALSMFLNYGIGFAFFVARFPEKYVPGAFDLILNSHQIWHIFVWLAGRGWLLGQLEFNSLKASQGHGLACAAATLADAAGALEAAAANGSGLFGWGLGGWL